MILNGNTVEPLTGFPADSWTRVAPVDPVQPWLGYLETGVTAYDQQIVSQNSSGAILLFVGLLLLAGMEK